MRHLEDRLKGRKSVKGREGEEEIRKGRTENQPTKDHSLTIFQLQLEISRIVPIICWLARPLPLCPLVQLTDASMVHPLPTANLNHRRNGQ